AALFFPLRVRIRVTSSSKEEIVGDYSAPRHRRSRRRVRFANSLIHRAVAVELLEQRRLLNADIVVNTTDDEQAAGGTTSLREAILLAETAPGDDNITVDPAVFTPASLHTINLGAAEPLKISNINGKIASTGPGADVLATSGAAAGRSFDIDDGAHADFSGMT